MIKDYELIRNPQIISRKKLFIWGAGFFGGGNI